MPVFGAASPTAQSVVGASVGCALASERYGPARPVGTAVRGGEHARAGTVAGLALGLLIIQQASWREGGAVTARAGHAAGGWVLGGALQVGVGGRRDRCAHTVRVLRLAAGTGHTERIAWKVAAQAILCWTVAALALAVAPARASEVEQRRRTGFAVVTAVGVAGCLSTVTGLASRVFERCFVELVRRRAIVAIAVRTGVSGPRAAVEISTHGGFESAIDAWLGLQARILLGARSSVQSVGGRAVSFVAGLPVLASRVPAFNDRGLVFDATVFAGRAQLVGFPVALPERTQARASFCGFGSGGAC